MAEPQQTEMTQEQKEKAELCHWALEHGWLPLQQPLHGKYAPQDGIDRMLLQKMTPEEHKNFLERWKGPGKSL